MTELLHGGSWGGGWDEPGVQGIVFIGAGLPGEGLFVYDTAAPAVNHLIYSIVPSAGQDIVGNTTLGGATSYSTQGGTYYAINLSQSGFPPRITWYVSGTDQTGTYSVMYGLYDTSSAGVHGLSLNNVPYVNPPGAWAAPLVISQPGAADPSVAETWHNMSLLNGWANAAGNTVARYRLIPSPDNSVQIQGVLDSSAATASTFITLPAAYHPSGAGGYAVGANGAVSANQAPQLRWASTGSLSIASFTPTAGVAVWITGIIPLD